MVEKKLKVYVASNVGIDYFFFLCKTISVADYDVQPLYLISEGSYRKNSKSRGLKKVWLRFQMYFLYPFYLIYKGIIAENGSIFVVSSNTFYTPFLLKKFIAFKRGKVIHMLYDLYPDAIEIAGIVKNDSLVSKLIGKITRLNLAQCDATVYLGSFLKEHAERRWIKAKKSEIIDISTDLTLYKSDSVSLLSNNKIIVHYGGQLGHLHDAKSLIECIKYVCASDIANSVKFNFYVSGAQADMLKNALKQYPVEVISAIPSSQWRDDIRAFHIGLVSLSPGGATVCIPSKTYGMMAGGMAILAVCPAWSDLAGLVEGLDAGIIVNNSLFKNKEQLNDNYLNNIIAHRPYQEIAEDFYQSLRSLLDNQSLLNTKRENSFHGIQKKFNIDLLSHKWHKIVQNVVER